MPELVIENVQCIHEFTLRIPEDRPGGAIVLKGTNGAGKTTTISVLNALLTGKGSLNVRDHAKKGTASGFGGEMTIGKTTRRKGDVEVPTLEGRFDLEALVNPREVTDKARFARRLRALIGLAQVKADPSLFYKLAGGQEALEAMVAPEKLKTDDLVELAAAIKYGIDAAARQAESDRDHAEQHEKAKMEAAQGIDIALPCDADALQEALMDAANHHTQLKTKASTYAAAKKAADEAAAKLTEFQKTAPDVKAAQESFIAACDQVSACATKIEQSRAEVERIEKLLAAAKDLHAANVKAEEQARVVAAEREKTLNAAKQTHEAAAEWKNQIAAVDDLPNPGPAEIIAAAEAEAKAKAAQETGIKVRGAKDALEKAGEFAAQKERHAKNAEKLREAAKNVDDVLSEQIPPGPLRIEADAFVLDNDRGKGVPFDECSDGQRYAIAIPYAVQAVGDGGIICLPQRAWQDLAPELRVKVAAVARDNKVWIVTGLVDDGELRQEVISPDA
jgi:energy-coupling factor transporter ATP-binding protein EcfA2